MTLRRKSVLRVLPVLLAGAVGLWLRDQHSSPAPLTREQRLQTASSTRAFQESYLDAATGRDTTHRTECAACHPDTDGLEPPRWKALKRRVAQCRTTWAQEIQLVARCGGCHVVPDPATLPQSSWSEVLERMGDLMESRKVPKLDPDALRELRHFYYSFSPAEQPLLAADPDPAESPLQFDARPLGTPVSGDPHDRPIVGHVELADLDGDGQPDVVVSDTKNSAVTWIHRSGGNWREDTLATLPFPAHTRVVPVAGRTTPDLVVACLGAIPPSDHLLGRAVRLVNDGAAHFTPVTLLDGVSRVADVAPGDFNGDGATDFVVAAYGYINQGEVGWLEHRPGDRYEYHPIVKRAGAIHVLPADLNGDGRLDFVALFAQEHEHISAFLNDGHGHFQERLLFKAATPSFGSSGIQLVDLDGDGDLDILYTNGDNMDLPNVIPRPFHGVQWLENQGNLSFVWHDVARFYGAYSAVAADLNRDGHLDLVVVSLFNDWADPRRASLLWLENDGRQHFAPHAIARQPIHLLSVAVGDLEGDGWPDIVASSMNAFPPFDRMGRVTFWKNRGAR